MSMLARNIVTLVEENYSKGDRKMFDSIEDEVSELIEQRIGELEVENKELKRRLNAKQTFWICPSCGSNTDVEFPEHIAELQAENKRLREVGVAYIESCNHEGENGDYGYFCELKDALSKDS